MSEYDYMAPPFKCSFHYNVSHVWYPGMSGIKYVDSTLRSYQSLSNNTYEKLWTRHENKTFEKYAKNLLHYFMAKFF